VTICEVAADGDLKIETHGRHPVVHEVQVFVHATAERTAECQSERAGRNVAVFSEDGAIGKEDARGIVGYAARIKQIPLLPVCVKLPAADQPRVEKIKALVARPGNLTIILGD